MQHWSVLTGTADDLVEATRISRANAPLSLLIQSKAVRKTVWIYVVFQACISLFLLATLLSDRRSSQSRPFNQMLRFANTAEMAVIYRPIAWYQWMHFSDGRR